MRVGLVVPIYHSKPLHADFTKETLESIKSEHEIWIYLIVNHSSSEYFPKKENYKLDNSIKNFEIVENPRGNHVSSSWNHGIKLGIQDACDYVIVSNNDIVFHPQCIDNLVDFAQKHQEFIFWTASEYTDLRTLTTKNLESHFDEYPHFSCFMVNKQAINDVGYFDENLQRAYFEDGDYHYRILLAGKKAGRIHGARFYHYGSRTIKIDEELNDRNFRSYEDNRAYLKMKWGIEFHGLVYNPPTKMLELGYKYPFNNPNKTLKEW